jgi:hypothetical protein
MVCIGTLNSHPTPDLQADLVSNEELVERHKFNRVPDALKPSEPGAAAHMSLHHSNNEKKRTAEPATFLPSQSTWAVRSATDLAVNRAPTGEAPLTRGYL